MTMIHTMDSSLERISFGYHHYFPCEFFLWLGVSKENGSLTLAFITLRIVMPNLVYGNTQVYNSQPRSLRG